MKWIIVFAITVMTTSAFGVVHECEKDAIVKAEKLLKLHYFEDSNASDIPSIYINETVTLRRPIKAPVGKGKFDVLEVDAGVYKAEYRLRFIYAQIKGACALMGQEIMGMSSPY